jgi:hypothetical protein
MKFRKTLGLLGSGLLAVSVMSSVSALADDYTYVNWSSATLSGSSPGSASGTMTVGSQNITVNYTGDVAYSTQINNSGNNYYSGWPSVYTNAVVSNSPTNVDVITLQENPAFTDTLTFSTPLLNPILDIVSLGNGGEPVGYNFSATPVILSQGYAYWGGCSSCLTVSGNTLYGTEGSGVVEFVGSYSSITWTTSGNEYWNGFTVGVAGLGSTATPEPGTVVLFSTLLLLGSGPGALGFLRRRRAF